MPSDVTPPPRGRPPRGRPPSAAKRQAIVEAGRSLLLAHGFAAVSMEAVAAKAGVSKMTLYKNFADKEALLEACLRLKTEDMFSELLKSRSGGGTLEEGLTALGRAFLDVVCRPEVVASERAFPLNLVGNPALAKRFYEAGPTRMLTLVADLLREVAQRGELRMDNPQEAAEDLLALWKGDLQQRQRLGLSEQPTPEQIATRVQRKVGTFLRAYSAIPPT